MMAGELQGEARFVVEVLDDLEMDLGGEGGERHGDVQEGEVR
jgi:hypothetical protein